MFIEEAEEGCQSEEELDFFNLLWIPVFFIFSEDV
jgi:hypothetical protein